MTQTVQAPNYTAMSKADLIEIIENQKTVIQHFYRLLPVSNKVLAPGEKLAWAAAKPLIDPEKMNEKGLVRIPIDAVAEKIGMSESSASRYILNMCKRFDATHEVEPYVTKKGQKCNLTYIDPTDPIWTTHPAELPLPPEKERIINGNLPCPHCRSEGTYRIIKKRTLTYQEIRKCDICHYEEVSEVLTENDRLEPTKKGPQAGEPFSESSEQPKGLQAGDLFEKLENMGCLPIDTQVPIARCNALEELQELPQWVVWRYGKEPRKDGKRDKVPYDVNRYETNCKAAVDKPETWTTYDEAKALVERSQRWHNPYAGVGFVFKEGGGLVGIDYDNSLAVRIPSYGEISVSGNGVHQFVRGSIPKGVRRNGIEMYSSGRFFTWTGDHLAGTPETIEECPEELDTLYKELVPEPTFVEKVSMVASCDHWTFSSDEVLQKARKNPKFSALWTGDIAGYPSHSEADLALCEILAWAGGNVSTIGTLFETSGLMRDKWKRADYRERTINRALGMQERRAS